MRRYFRDVQDHLSRTVEQVNSYDDLLNSILQARLAQVTVDQNNDMRKIAAWAAIAAVWTAIAGIYGMNFDVHAGAAAGVRLPGRLRADARRRRSRCTACSAATAGSDGGRRSGRGSAGRAGLTPARRRVPRERCGAVSGGRWPWRWSPCSSALVMSSAGRPEASRAPSATEGTLSFGWITGGVAGGAGGGAAAVRPPPSCRRRSGRRPSATLAAGRRRCPLADGAPRPRPHRVQLAGRVVLGPLLLLAAAAHGHRAGQAGDGAGGQQADHHPRATSSASSCGLHVLRLDLLARAACCGGGLLAGDGLAGRLGLRVANGQGQRREGRGRRRDTARRRSRTDRRSARRRRGPPGPAGRPWRRRPSPRTWPPASGDRCPRFSSSLASCPWVFRRPIPNTVPPPGSCSSAILHLRMPPHCQIGHMGGSAWN